MIKKTLSLFMLVTMLLISINTSTVNAANENYDSQYIKVGLERKVKAKDNIKLVGKGFTVGFENGNVSELFKTNSTNIVAKLKKFGYHIELSENFISYDKASSKVKELKALGMDSYVAYQQGFKVWVGEFKDENSAKQFLTKNARLKSESAKVSKNLSLISIEDMENKKIISFDKNQNIYIKSLVETTKVEGINYRGYIGFVDNKNKVTTINNIKIEDYLKGVIPGEMPASWEIEALKAQAVSARSYALRNSNKHKNLGYNLCDSDNCQVYNGYDAEKPKTNKAILETRDKVLKYNGKIAETFYSSCSGGHTSNNEDVWNGAPIPYLRGKRDPYSDNTPQSNWTYTVSKVEAEKKLKAAGYDVGKIISLSTTKDNLGARSIELIVVGTKGTKIVPKGKIREVFGNTKGVQNIKSTNYKIEGEINDSVQTPPVVIPPIVPTEPVEPEVIKDIYVLSGNDSNTKKGSIENINVMTSEGVKKINPKLQNVVMSNGVQQVAINTKKPIEQKPAIVSVTNVASLNSLAGLGNTITFKGSGWGHGIGMSQHGANNMAKEGKNFREILEFYFTGTKVE